MADRGGAPAELPEDEFAARALLHRHLRDAGVGARYYDLRLADVIGGPAVAAWLSGGGFGRSLALGQGLTLHSTSPDAYTCLALLCRAYVVSGCDAVMVSLRGLADELAGRRDGRAEQSAVLLVAGWYGLGLCPLDSIDTGRVEDLMRRRLDERQPTHLLDEVPHPEVGGWWTTWIIQRFAECNESITIARRGRR